MNRLYTQFRLSLEKRMIDIYAQFSVGATGAPTLNAPLSKGVASVARVSAGLYDVTLADPYVALMGVLPTITLASGAPAAVGGMVVRSYSIASGRAVIRVLFVDGAGAAVELNNGAVVNLKFELKGTSV